MDEMNKDQMSEIYVDNRESLNKSCCKSNTLWETS